MSSTHAALKVKVDDAVGHAAVIGCDLSADELLDAHVLWVWEVAVTSCRVLKHH